MLKLVSMSLQCEKNATQKMT